MKRFFSLFLSFVLLFAVCACSREKNLTELEEIQQQLAEMEGYACTATLIRQTENGEKIYETKVNDRIIRDVPESQHRSELFLGQFIRNYMQSEGVSVETASFDSSKCIVLEAVIPGNDDGLATEKLWIDRESLLPVRFVIYDADDKERYRMDYHEFTFHPQFDAPLFLSILKTVSRKGIHLHIILPPLTRPNSGV